MALCNTVSAFGNMLSNFSWIIIQRFGIKEIRRAQVGIKTYLSWIHQNMLIFLVISPLHIVITLLIFLRCLMRISLDCDSWNAPLHFSNNGLHSPLAFVFDMGVSEDKETKHIKIMTQFLPKSLILYYLQTVKFIQDSLYNTSVYKFARNCK